VPAARPIRMRIPMITICRIFSFLTKVLFRIEKVYFTDRPLGKQES
jgi:hypothetical protein